MKTVFDKQTRDELVNRISTLNVSSTPQWGKMNVYQVIKHCALADEMLLGRRKYERSFLGRVLGQWALKGMLKDDKPLRKNSPTSPDFKVIETEGDVPGEKLKWIELIEAYETYNNEEFVHWFFGKMTKEQVGYFAYKHADHHLRQFGC